MKKFRLIQILLPILVLTLSTISCSKVEDGLNSMTWRIDFNLISSTWDVQFIDARTGELIEGTEENRVQVIISGPDQNHILDLSGFRRDRFYTSHGFLGLALHPDRNSPTPVSPLRFVLKASHPDYLPVSFPVTTRHDGINPLQIRMVHKGVTPPHVAVAAESGMSRVVEGRLQDSLEIFVPANLASVKFQQYTLLQDKENHLLGGSLDITFGYWEASHFESTLAQPGGQLALTTENGKPGVIYSAGMFYLNVMDEYGQEPDEFDLPARAQVILAADIHNPETGSSISINDRLNLWYQDPATGLWSIVNTLRPSPYQNKFVIHIPFDRPGTYLLGWISEETCNEALVIHFKTLPEYNLLPYGFSVNTYQLVHNELRLLRSEPIVGPVDQEVKLYDLPTGKELVFRFEPYLIPAPSYYRSPDPLLVANSCSATGHELDLLPRPGGTFTQVKVVFIDTQHNNTRYTPRVFPGYYRQAGTQPWQSAFVYQGLTYLVNLVIGGTYELGINFKGEFHKKEMVIGTGELVEIEIELE